MPDPGRQDELKRAVLAVRRLRARVAELEAGGGAGGPVAVIGMSCRLPGGSDTPDRFWSMLREGRDATRPVPEERWDVERFHDPDPEAPGRIYFDRGGFLDEPVDRFDAAFFGISPREASSMDPVQRLLLELSWEAFEHAGIAPDSLDGSSTGVFVGVSGTDYESILTRNEGYEEINAYRGTGTAASVAGGRISHVLGLRGPNLSVDTACSSSLASVTLALDQLRNGRCDLALAGGAQLILEPGSSVFLCRLRALSQGGRCRTFSSGADGYARGEGGVLFVLKRLADARRDGDRIHAVIRGGACNHDGHSSGLTVPNMGAQRDVIRAALADAELRPADIGYVEAHGTATPLGDPIELRALAAALGDRGDAGPLLVGSVKTNIGHAEAAAGATGLLKAILMVERGHVPPHLHFDEPSPHVDWASMPLRVMAEGGAWTPSEGPRRAGVSSFGFSGTNAHVIVEEYREETPIEAAPRSAEWLPISARSPEALRRVAERMADAVKRGTALADLSSTLVAGRSALPWRHSVVAADSTDAARQFEAIAAGDGPSAAEARGLPEGGVTMLFTGQGSAWPGMGRELLDAPGPAREMLERCDALLRPHVDWSLIDLLREENDPEAWRATGLQQPVLYALEMALYALWRSWGVTPSRVAGHSLGEYVAATVAGVMSLDDALPLVALRGRLMQELPEGGAMLALNTDEATAGGLLREGVSIASVNGPRATVVSGDAEAVRALAEVAREQGLRATELKVSHAFHSHRMDPMLPAFAEAVDRVALSAPRIPLISNLTGVAMTPDEARDPSRWVRHIREAVRFADTFTTLAEAGARTVLEVGAHPALSAMGAEALDAGVRWLPSLRRGMDAWPVLASSIGELYRAGFDLDLAAFAAQRGGRRIAAPSYPFERERFWLELAPKSARPAAESLHPLLGAAISSPAIDGWVFEQGVGPGVPTWLDDHRVQGRRVVPGAAWIEAALAAAEHGPGWASAGIESVDFERPLVADEPRTLQTVVDPVVDGRVQVRFFAAVEEAGAGVRWERVATAIVTDAPPQADPLPPVEGREIDVVEASDRLEAAGLGYGPSFHRLSSLSASPEGFTAGIVPLDPGSHRIHPGVIDTAFQGLTGVWANLEIDTPMLPIRVGACRFPAGGEPVESIVGRVRSGDAAATRRPTDFDFLDGRGRVVGWIRGFEARAMAGGPVLREGPGDAWFVDWTPVESPDPAENEAEAWWVVGPEGPTADRVEEALVATGARVQRTGLPRDDADLTAWATAAAEEAGLAGIALVSERSAPDAGPAVEELADRLLAVRSLLLETPTTLPITLVTRGAAGPGGAPSMPGADLHGLQSVVRAEQPERRCRVVDLDPWRSTPLDLLGRWLRGASEEDRVALRDGETFAPRLAPLADRSGVSPRLRGENYRIALGARGTLDTIRYEAVARSAPEAGEVEVRVEATGLNFRDVLNVLGRYPGDPGLPGVEFAGVVERVGPGVEALRPGDRVMGMHLGMFTRFATVPIRAVVRCPDSLDFAEAATVPVAFLTAVWALEHVAALQPGERVLIHAGTGGVGQAAIQVARAVGAEVYTTAGSDWKRQLLRDQGVRHIFDSRSVSFHEGILEATGGEGVHVVLNALTGDLLQRSLDLLGEGGRFVELGKAELLDPAQVEAERGVRYTAFELGTIPLDAAAYREFVSSVADRFDRGDFVPPAVRTFAAEEIRHAFRYMAQARHVGKLAVQAGRPRNVDPIRPDGLYLVTGATGGVGRALIEGLAEGGAGAILATARSRPSPELQSRFDTLAASGCEIRFVAADVGRDEGVATLAEACADHALELVGVFHAAGALDDRALAEVDRDSVHTVADAKVGGAIRLDRAFPEVETFVVFGSIAGVMGGAGQGAYAAANAALGALVEARRHAGRSGLCVDWGAWAGEGMADRLGESGRRMLARRGMGLLLADAVVERLVELVDDGVSRALVAEIDWARAARSSGPTVPPVLDTLLVDRPGADAPVARLDIEALPGLGEDERNAAIREYVRSALASVLGLDPARLDDGSEVARLGFDSLMAVELRNRFQSDLDLQLQVASLLESGTVLDLAEVVNHHLALDLARSATSPGDGPTEIVETFEF